MAQKSPKSANPARTHTGAGNGHLSTIRAEEAAVDEVENATERLRSSGRAAVGVTGTAEKVASLRETFATAGVSIYPAVALGLLLAVDQLQTTALTVLGPEITVALGIPRPTYALVLVLKTLVVTVAALPIAAFVQRKARRAAVCVITAFVWAVLTATTSIVTSIWGLAFIALAAGAATGSVRSVHEPLLLDSYPPPARMRVMSFYRAFDYVGNSAGPLMIGLCATVLGLTWRGSFLGMGVLALVAAVVALRLRDPGFGRWDIDRVREIVRADTGTADLDEDEVRLGFFEIFRRVILIRTVWRLLVAWAVIGMMLAPLLTYQSFFLQERWGLGPGGRAAFFGAIPVFGIIGLRIYGRRGEEMFRQDPARVLRLAGLLLMFALVVLSLALFSPVFALTLILWGVAQGTFSVLFPALSLPMFALVPAHMRPQLGALQGIFLAGVGGTAGLLLLSGVETRFGTSSAIFSLALPGIAAGFVLRTAAKTVNADLDRMVDAIVEEEEVRGMAAKGIALPMLACRHIDFSYGQLQVLFDVDFTVDDGEMVALLGTNGAGKSTLLKAISGIGLPTNGSVRYRGADITYLDAGRRVGLGITQIPGGRAVFGPMTVVENLRSFGYTIGRDRKALDRSVERCFEAFPRLHERRHSLASTLSGGEQQMLGVSKALILRPRLLLIDELSLGLAPVIVGQLLDMVREINASGTAVVLVEQSVNIALNLVDHAYFMEKGQMRFDGPSAELLARDDLLRAVFLHGAAAVGQ